MDTLLTDATKLLLGSARVLLLTHGPADGDGLSTILALKAALTKLGVTAVAAADGVPQMLHFLPGAETVRGALGEKGVLTVKVPLMGREVKVASFKEGDTLFVTFATESGAVRFDELKEHFGEMRFDVIVVADTPELSRLGRIFESMPDLFYDTPVISIDHHVSNSGFGTVQLVDTAASSSAEIAYRLLRALEQKSGKELVDADTATLLLTGIITDTGSFQHANTTPRCLDAASELIDAGARQQEIIQYLYKTKPLSQLKLWGRVLEKVVYEEEHQLVHSTITGEDLRASQATDEEAGGIVDELLTSAPGAEVVVLLKQNGVGTRGSVRTLSPRVSAQDIAALFGGGGHTQAAGFLVTGKTVEECEKEVLQQVREYCARVRREG